MDSAIKQEAFEVFDMLEENEQRLMLELMKKILPEDCFATPEEIAAHDEFLEEYERGEYVRHEDIKWK